jgi:hypothetical protein
VSVEIHLRYEPVHSGINVPDCSEELQRLIGATLTKLASSWPAMSWNDKLFAFMSHMKNSQRDEDQLDV